MSSWNPIRSPLAWLLIAALAVRVAAGLWAQSRVGPGQQFAFGDSDGYWKLAGTLARGEPYEYGAPPARIFRAPGYPLILASLFLLYGGEPPITAAIVLNAGLGTITVAGVYALAALLFDLRTARIAGAIAAFYPGAIGMSAFVLSEAAFCPLLIAQLFLSTLAWQAARVKQSVFWALAAGALGGAATLVRPSWLFFTPLAALIGLFGVRVIAQRLTISCCLIFGMAAIMAPWWVRNYHEVGHFVPTTLQVGASLYDGQSPHATGASNMSFVPEFAALEQRNPADNETYEYRLDRRLRHAAVDWMTTHPGRVLQLAGIKFLRLWNVWPNEAEFRSWPLRLAVFATYVPLLLLSLYGAWRFTGRGWPYILCWLPAGYFTAIHMIFVSSIRYREPVMLSLAVLAAAAVVFPSQPADRTLPTNAFPDQAAKMTLRER